MDDAERRFRDCVDRFKRDLTTIIFQSIDSMVLEAEQRAANQAISLAGKGSLPEKAKSSRSQRSQRGAPSSQRTPEKRGARKGRGASRSDGVVGFEFELELAKVLPAKSKPSRVRADSILGAELAHGLDAASAAAAVDAAGGHSSINGSSVYADATNGDAAATLVSSGPATRFRPSSKPPSERPLFVHRRARDGQIHALRRVRDAAPAEVNANSADSGR